MLLWLLATCLLSAGHADGELELGWPFGDPDYVNLTATHDFAPMLDAVSSLYCRQMGPQGLTCKSKLPEQCLLWNSSCSGNKTEALDEFFNNTGTMRSLVYVACEYYAQHRHVIGIPPKENDMIVSWMRDPDCRSSFFEWHTENLDQPTWTYTDRIGNEDVVQTLDWGSIAATSLPYGCCDACELVGGDVDVYYWPVAGANTDCVASVGTTAASTIDQNLIVSDDRGVGEGWWTPQPNPYLPTSVSSSSNSAPLASINARGHALLSAPADSSGSLIIVTQNGFTLWV